MQWIRVGLMAGIMTVTCGQSWAAEPVPAVLSATVVNTNAIDRNNPPVFVENTPFSAEIVVENPYDQAVKVGQVDSTCTCSHLSLAEHFLLPHARTTLHMTVDNTNRSGRQRIGVSLYLSDPSLEPIEIDVLWETTPHVYVDSLLGQESTLERPPRAFRDIYRYPSKARPDELHRLEKRVLIGSPDGEVPAGGLRIEDIQYTGVLWKFTATPQANGTILFEAAGQRGAQVADGVVEETVTLITNHPKKPRIELVFLEYIGKDAGQITFDPDALRDPPPMLKP